MFRLIAMELALISQILPPYVFVHYVLVSANVGLLVYSALVFNCLVLSGFIVLRKEINYSNFDQTAYERCMIVRSSERRLTLKKR